MNWESFYLICFLIGLGMSVVSLLGGMGHFSGHVHVPHVPHAGHGLPHGAHLPHAPGESGAAQSSATVPWWNAFSLMIFFCWFGAAGYLLTRYGGFVASVVLVLAVVCGFIGGALVFMFLTKVLMPHERELTADETEVVGVVGLVSSPIRSGGIGEIVYEQLGARHSVPARSDNGDPIQKQEEVYVVAYEKGVASVRRSEELISGVDR
ncbi:MAG: hypothetical protein P4L40_07045 [Terracidiphilus sp.]|nr:hypothetical protein [Terracidiphilus sp.]